MHPSHSQCFDHRCQSWHYVVESAETVWHNWNTTVTTSMFKKGTIPGSGFLYHVNTPRCPTRIRGLKWFCVWINKINRMTRWNTLGHVLAPNLRRDCVRGPNPAKKFDLSERSRIFKNQDSLRSTLRCRWFIMIHPYGENFFQLDSVDDLKDSSRRHGRRLHGVHALHELTQLCHLTTSDDQRLSNNLGLTT